MKKVVLFCMMLLMSVSLCLSVSANPGWFVSSPSGNSAPIEVDFKPSNENCTADLIVVSYAARHQLADADRIKLERAYNDIVSATDITALNANLAKIAQQKGIAATDLVVSDLFDLMATNCEGHDISHGEFTVTLSAETLKGFVGLIHYNGEAWTLVQPARVEGDNLIFTVDSFSPFAIVVDANMAAADAEAEEESDFDPINLLAYCSIIGAAALSIIVLWKKS